MLQYFLGDFHGCGLVWGFVGLVGSAVMAKVRMGKVVGSPEYVDGAALRDLFYTSYNAWAEAGLLKKRYRYGYGYANKLTADETLRFHLAELLGYKDYYTMIWADASEYQASIQAMAGEHGYAIYRMLLIKRGMT